MSCLVQRSLLVLEVTEQTGWGCCLLFRAPRASQGPCLLWTHGVPPRMGGRTCHLTEEDWVRVLQSRLLGWEAAS